MPGRRRQTPKASLWEYYCTKCKTLKPREDFGPDKRTKSGLQSSCRQCMREYHKALYHKDIEKSRQENRTKQHNLYYKDINKYRQASLNSQRNRYARDPGKFLQMKSGNARSYRLRRKYGLTEDQYIAKLIEQDYKCALCGEIQSNLERTLAVDHDHVTGQIRDLICNHCNLGLGNFKDDISLLQKAQDYLRRHRIRLVNSGVS